MSGRTLPAGLRARAKVVGPIPARHATITQCPVLPRTTDEKELWPAIKALSPAKLKDLARDDSAPLTHVRLARLALTVIHPDEKRRKAALAEIRELEARPPRDPAPTKPAPAKKGKAGGAVVAASPDGVLQEFGAKISAEQLEAVQGTLEDLQGLTQKERVAALVFAFHPVRTEAARRAGYSGDAAHASRLFKRPHMQAAVGALHACLEEQFIRRLLYQRERVIQRYEDMADFDPLQYVTENGFDIERLRAENPGQVFVNAVEVEAKEGARRVKMSFVDQKQANDKLAAIAGLLNRQEPDTAPPPTIVCLGVFGTPEAIVEKAAEKDVTPARKRGQ